MNILPKKRWHVRTKQNIERVRRDEAEAREKEKHQEQRAQLAEQEARISELRKKSHTELCTGASPGSANDILGKLESSVGATVNKDYEAEKKSQKEKFEKDIGLLTYLGQNCSEKPWYLEKKRKLPDESEELNKKKSILELDPLTDMKKYLSSIKKEESTKTDSHIRKSLKTNCSKGTGLKHGKSIEQMRAVREERERKERERARLLLEKRNL